MTFQNVLENSLVLDLVLDNLVKEHFIKDSDVLDDINNLRNVFVHSKPIKDIIDERTKYVENAEHRYFIFTNRTNLLLIDHNMNKIVKTENECIESIQLLCNHIASNKDKLMKMRPKMQLSVEKTKNEIMKMNKNTTFKAKYGNILYEQLINN
uniref:Uncharacterized protein n=1 Tax=Pyramimonas orientalis virus TaxID=455367 RepID=A0A7M3UPB0_POV01|nr:hypothetical protein HWQ62_00456 [Pyramimonas orientalis virus]